jgi:hypothetical protein
MHLAGLARCELMELAPLHAQREREVWTGDKHSIAQS